MKFIRRKALILFIIIMPILLYGCGNKSELIGENNLPLSINKGSVIFSGVDGSEILNFENGSYVESMKEEDRQVIEYNSKESMVYVKEGKGIVFYKGKEYALEESKMINGKLSPNGSKFLYFVENEDSSLLLKILDLNVNEYLELGNINNISGNLVDWYDDKSIVYYGVSEDRVNGIFTYDIEKKTNKLLYEIKEGFISFLKNTSNGVVVKLDSFIESSVLKIINKDKNEKVISDDIENIFDVEILNDDIYILGNNSGEITSLYKYNEGLLTQCVYNFPTNINFEKGLSKTENNEVLFVGYNNNIRQSYVYKFYNGTVEKCTEKSGEYDFIKFNSY